MSTIKANTLLHSDGSTTTQPSIPALDQRMAKAWCAFNGTGTVSIHDAYNISSITDNAVGYFRANITTALANNNYSIVGGGDGQNTASAHLMYDSNQGVRSTTSFGCRNTDINGVIKDSNYLSFIVFGT